MESRVLEVINTRFKNYREGYEAFGGTDELILVIDEPVPLVEMRSPCCDMKEDFVDDKTCIPPVVPFRTVRYRLRQCYDSKCNFWWQFVES